MTCKHLLSLLLHDIEAYSVWPGWLDISKSSGQSLITGSCPAVPNPILIVLEIREKTEF